MTFLQKKKGEKTCGRLFIGFFIQAEFLALLLLYSFKVILFHSYRFHKTVLFLFFALSIRPYPYICDYYYYFLYFFLCFAIYLFIFQRDKLYLIVTFLIL